MGHLREGRIREAWGTIWGWHKIVEPKAAKPCFWTMEDQTRGREELYGFQQPPGEKSRGTWNARRQTTARPQTKGCGGQPCVVGTGSPAAQAPCGPRI